MSTTKIILNLQSDKVLSDATITSPLGIIAEDIQYGQSNVSVELGSLEMSISTETSTRISGDTAIYGVITENKNASDMAEFSLDQKIGQEASYRESADQVIYDTFQAKDASIEGRINSTETELTNETNSRIFGDNSIVSQLAQYTGETSTEIATERSVRVSADASIVTVIEANEVANDAADASLTSRISTEEVARASADLSLTSSVSTEISSRISADASLQAEISSINAADFGRVATTHTNGTDVWTLTTNVLENTEFVYLNGLLQVPGTGNDYVATVVAGKVTAIVFEYDAEDGRVQVAGQVIA
jgi:hypothetical protein